MSHRQQIRLRFSSWWAYTPFSQKLFLLIKISKGDKMKSHLMIGLLLALTVPAQPITAQTTTTQILPKTEETPTNFEWYSQQGKQFLQSSRFGQAIEMYKKALDLRPEDYDSLWSLGQSYFSIGKFQEGLEVAQKAVQISPASANART